MDDVKLNLGLTSSASVDKAIWIAQKAERIGLEGVIVGEDLGRRQDIFTLTALMLMRSSRTKVGIGITSPLYHNLTTIGRSSATLNSIAPGRLILGVGVGGLQDLAKAGIRVERPEEALRNTVSILKSIWSDRTITHSSRHYKLQGYSYRGEKGSIPIIFGVRGPKLLKLAGEVSDGAIISGSKSYLSNAVAALTESLHIHKRSRKSFRIIAWTPTIVTVGGKGLETAKKIVATVIADTPEKVLSQLRLDLESIREVKHLVSIGMKDKAQDLIDNSMMDEFCISGEADEIVEKLRGLRSIGVDEVVFGPPYGSQYRYAIELLAKEWRAQ